MNEFLKRRVGFKVFDAIGTIIFVAAVITAELFMFATIIYSAMAVGGFGLLTIIDLLVMALLIFVACAWYMAAIILCDLAKAKGANNSGFLFIGLVASPIILALIVLAIPAKTLPVQQFVQPANPVVTNAPVASTVSAPTNVDQQAHTPYL